MPITENFTVPRGDDVQLDFIVQAPPEIDLTGASIKWRVYAMHLETSVGAPLIEKDTDPGGGITITDEVERTYSVQVLASELEALEGRYYHESEITGDNGKLATTTTGVMTITRTKIHAES